MDNYGDRLRAARRIRKLTQTELATQLGITQKSYQRMESGVHDLKMSTIYQLCKALNISADWLLGLNTDVQNPYGFITICTSNYDNIIETIAKDDEGEENATNRR